MVGIGEVEITFVELLDAISGKRNFESVDGIIFKCNFCYRLDKGFRPRSAKSIVEEIVFLKEKYNVKYIAFSDELLMSSRERTIEICDALYRANMKLIKKYQEVQFEKSSRICKDLYYNKNAEFRGFRQT